MVPGGADVQSVHAGAVQITFSKFSKSDLRDHLWDDFGGHLGRVWGHFGAGWAHSGTLGRFFDKKRGLETRLKKSMEQRSAAIFGQGGRAALRIL